MPDKDFSLLQFPPGVSCPSNILMHSSAQEELQYIVRRNPQSRAQLKSKLNGRLTYLSQNLGRETQHSEWFEHLEGVPYKSMRFAHVKLLGNLRIIYGIANEKAYLLVAFTEQNASDYDRALRVAKHRAEGVL